MKIFNNKIFRYAALGLIILIGLFLYSSKYTPKEAPVGESAGYLLTSEQSLLETHFLNDSLGQSVVEVENENTQLAEIERSVNSLGYIDVRYREVGGTPVEVISDRQGNVAATIRTPLSASEESATGLKNKLGLGDPEAVMYPSGASIEIVHVYPKEGVAIYFNEEHDRVFDIITFKSTTLQEFKNIFEGKYQETRNTKAY